MTSAAGVRLRVFDDLLSLSSAAASLVTEVAARAIGTNGTCSIALSGGTTPLTFYSLLGCEPFRTAIDWDHVHLFWADERCVPPDDGQSNYRAVAESLLKGVAVPARNIHRIRGELDPGEAARLYEKELVTFLGPRPAFDLEVLGAGEDGHTASLFPGSSALGERSRLAVPVLREPPSVDRITLTLPVLNDAGRAVFLVAGAEKAGIVREVLVEGNKRELPAGLVRPRSGVLDWYVDRPAASGSGAETA